MEMRKNLISLCLFIILCGCASTPDYDTKLFFVSPGVDVQQLEARHFVREKDGHTLLNISGLGTGNQVVYYKVDWYNEYNMPIKSIMSTWKSASIVKNMPFSWDAVSPSSKAVSFKVLITKNIGSGILN